MLFILQSALTNVISETFSNLWKVTQHLKQEHVVIRKVAQHLKPEHVVLKKAEKILLLHTCKS